MQTLPCGARLRLVRLGVFLPLLALCGCAHAALDDEEAIMDVIERRVALPPRAAPLSHYRRYYTWSQDRRDLIDAIYLREGRPERLWLNWLDMPIPFDGPPCAIIRFSFAPGTRRFSQITC